MTALLCCEGRGCGNGLTADEREADLMAHLPQQSVPLRDEAERYARQMTSRELAVTPHSHFGTDGRGNHWYLCDRCGHARLYGNTALAWQPSVTPDDRRDYFGRGTFKGEGPL